MSDDPLMAAASSAILKLLEALAPFSMEVGIGVGDVQALTEKAFVSAAQTLLSESGESDPENTARIAVRTGLYRSTVNTLLGMTEPQAVRNKPFQNAAVRVMRAWQTLPDYCDPGGTPKILPARGEPPTFQSLIKASIGDDLSPRSILQDLQRVGAVKRVGKRHIQLIRNTYGNVPWDVAQIRRVGEELGDHLRVIFQLMQRRAPPPLRRFVVHEGLPVETAAILERELAGGANVLFNGHERAIAHAASATRNAPGQKHRLSAAIFVLREPALEELSGNRPPRARAAPTKKRTTQGRLRKKT